jgi:hypothetical protein
MKGFVTPQHAKKDRDDKIRPSMSRPKKTGIRKKTKLSLAGHVWTIAHNDERVLSVTGTLRRRMFLVATTTATFIIGLFSFFLNMNCASGFIITIIASVYFTSSSPLSIQLPRSMPTVRCDQEPEPPEVVDCPPGPTAEVSSYVGTTVEDGGPARSPIRIVCYMCSGQLALRERRPKNPILHQS